MLDWLRNNVAILSLVASMATVVIWLLYLSLFYREYRRREVPHIVIKQGYGFDLDTMCYVTNMSQQTVDVLASLIRAQRGEESVIFVASEMSERPADHRRIEQPLEAGSLLELGTFRSLMEQAQDHLPGASDEAGELAVELEVRVVALVGPQQVPRGARRRFRILPDGDQRYVQPHDVLPQQLATRQQRRLVRQWLEQAQELETAGQRHALRSAERAG